MPLNGIFEHARERLLDAATRFTAALEEARIPYRVVGGLAAFLHVECIQPIAARLTPDVDVAVERRNVRAIRKAATSHGFEYRPGDVFVDVSAKGRVVHLLFAGEKVRPDDLAPVPFSEPTRTVEGILIAPVADLVRMKLTSFRLKDKIHIQDMDSVGLITPEIEQSLSPEMRERLQEVRATE